MSSGQYQHVPNPPYTPGLEYAGVVSWKGSAAGNHVEVGDAVIADGALTGPRSLGAHRAWGGWASWAVAPSEALLRIPGTLSFDEGCNLLGNYETAYHCLIARGRLAAGESVLILGASGATGLAAVQIAKLSGATVIATGRSAEKLALVREHGADHVIVTGRARSRTRSRHSPAVVASTSSTMASAARSRSRHSGHRVRCALFDRRLGVDSVRRQGQGSARRTERQSAADEPDLDEDARRARLSDGDRDASRSVDSAPAPGEDLGVGRAGLDAIRPHVSHRFPLSAIHDAMRAKWSGEVTGGCVVHPGG